MSVGLWKSQRHNRISEGCGFDLVRGNESSPQQIHVTVDYNQYLDRACLLAAAGEWPLHGGRWR